MTDQERINGYLERAARKQKEWAAREDALRQALVKEWQGKPLADTADGLWVITGEDETGLHGYPLRNVLGDEG